MSFAALIFSMLKKRMSIRNRKLLAEAYNTEQRMSAKTLAKQAIKVTFIIEGTCALLLSFRMVPIFGLKVGLAHSIFLAVSGFCNAGIDCFGNFQSLTNYIHDPLVNFVIMALIVLGGIGFAVILDVLKQRKFSKLQLHSKVVISMTALLIIAGALSFVILERNNPATMADLPATSKMMAGAFQSVTARTAGFNTISQDGMTLGSKLTTCILMFIGASPASTGGGIKTTTFVLLIAMVIPIVRGREDTTIARRRIPTEIVKRAIAIALIMFTLALLFSLVLCIVEADKGAPFTLENIFLEVFSAFGTVGLSAGITPSLTALSKILLILGMYIGRVGPLTLTIALAGKEDHTHIRYAEDRIMIG